jgi:type I restriction enzyme S subunit
LAGLFSGGTPETGNTDFWSNDDSGIPWVAIGDMSGRDRVESTEKRITEEGRLSRGLSLLPSGTLIYSMYASLGHVAELAIPAVINQALLGFEFNPGVNKRYVKWQLQRLQSRVAEEANSSTQDNLNAEKVRNLRVPLPPPTQQLAIADYLDRETARIDALIAAKERVLGLLAEKRRALITRAVTRGLDPAAPLRDSGIPWLGEIPTHWETRRIAWLYRERDERGEPELPLLEVSINSGVVLREFSDERIESTAADFNTYKVARRGDVVFNKMRMWQGAVGVAPEDGLVSPDYVVAAPTGSLSSAYSQLLFRTSVFSAECARHSHGIVWDRLRLYWDGFRDIAVPLPPAKEQGAIVASTEGSARRLDALGVATQRSIALLKERRASLIAAAVTGQIDVESAA